MLELYHWEPNGPFLKPLIALHEKDVAFTSRYFDPLSFEPLLTTMTWRLVGVVIPSPSRFLRSSTGITAPRRLMTPSTNGGACGRGVEAV